MSESDTNEPEKTIDADFEPAPAADYVLPKDEPASSGPGWLSLGVVGALSAGALGLSAVNFSNSSVDPDAFAPASISDSFQQLRSEQDTVHENIESLKKSAEASEKRMAAQIEALLSGDEDTEGLAALVTELEAVSTRLDEAMASSGDAEALIELETRVVALEEADNAEAVSPRQMNRAVTALRERVKQLETQNEDLVSQLETRAEALAAITSRIEDVEFALQDGMNAIGAGDSDLLSNLQAEMENLKSSVERTEEIDVENEKRFTDLLKDLQASGVSEAKASDAEARAAAALALSRIEAAAREGRSFHAAYEKLREAMPGDPAIEALSSIASSGAPTLSQLSTRFAGDKSAALDAEDVSTDDGWGWTRQVFGDGVKVRRSSEAGGPSDLLDKAEASLASGDLAAAVKSVESLPDASKTVMADWLSDATARLELEDALDEIGVKLIGQGR